MLSAAGILLLLLLVLGSGALAARWLGRPLGGAVLLLSVLLPTLFLAPGVFGGKTPIPADAAFLTVPVVPPGPPYNVWLNDVALQFAPWAEATRASWREGSLPHRNRWSGSGMALSSNGSSAAYSPLTWLGLLLPLGSAFTFWGAVRLGLSLAGTWLWLTEIGVSRRSALFGAVCFSFSLAITAWLFFPQTAVLCLWPWVLFTVERLWDPAFRSRAFATLTGLFLLWPLSGHLESVASASAFAGLWLLARAAAGEREGTIGLFARILGAALLALLLSAFSLVPQALAILASNRFALTEVSFYQDFLSPWPHGPVWTWGGVLTLFPRLSGDGIRSPLISSALASFPEMTQGYFGIVGVAFLALILRPGSPRPRAELALLVPLVFGLGAGIGLWPFAEIVSLTPLFRRMMPTRFLVWFALAGAAIAAFEIDRLARDLPRGRTAWRWATAALAVLLAVGGATYRHFSGAYLAAGSLLPARNGYLLGGAAVVCVLGVVLRASRRPQGFGAAGPVLLTLITGAELFRQGSRLYRFWDPAALYPATPIVQRLRSQPRPFRIAGQGPAIFPNVGAVARLEDVRTHDAVERRDYVEFLDASCGYDPKAYFKTLSDLDCPALDFLNVRYLVTPLYGAPPPPKWKSLWNGPDGGLYENPRALPRVFRPESIRVVSRPSEGHLPEGAERAYGVPLRGLLSGMDLSREAVVLRDGRSTFAPREGENGAARIFSYAETANSVSFRARAETARGAILVASLVQDGGWSATDQTGRRLPTGRANGPFLAIAIPAGERHVRLSYAPPGFLAGSLLSAAGLAAAVVLGVRRRRRRRMFGPARHRIRS